MKQLHILWLRFLNNKYFGNCLCWLFSNNIPCLRHLPYRFSLQHHPNKQKLAAPIFWGFYEQHEIKLTQKHFTGMYDVVELGSSAGVMSSFILSKLSGKKYIAVEGNSFLNNTFWQNVNKYNRNNCTVTLCNQLIGNKNEATSFAVQDKVLESNFYSTGGKVINTTATTLSNLLQKQQIEAYSLFADIEGAEIFFIEDDNTALTNCKEICIELHEGKFGNQQLTAASMITQLQSIGFAIAGQSDMTWYFIRA
jgi:FkbM family methyltransferase